VVRIWPILAGFYGLLATVGFCGEEVAGDDDIITGGDETTRVAGGGEVTQIPVDSELFPDQVI